MQTLEVVGLAILAGVAAGCSAYTVQPIPGLAAQEALGHAKIERIQIGAQPYQDFVSAKSVFNQSPMENGVLPILLVVDNSSEMDIEITRVRIELESLGKRLEPLDRFTTFREAALVAPPAFLWVFPTTNTQDMALDWAVKCVPDLLVCKRSSTVRAFLYFRVGKKFAESKAESCTLIVPFEHADRSKRQSVKIPLEIQKRTQKPIPKEDEEFDFDIG